MNKELLMAYIFGVMAIVLGLVIMLVGKVGSGVTDSYFEFRGVARLYGLYPIALGCFFIWGFRVKHLDKDNQDK